MCVCTCVRVYVCVCVCVLQGPMITSPWDRGAAAIVVSWLPGVENGNGIARALFILSSPLLWKVTSFRMERDRRTVRGLLHSSGWVSHTLCCRSDWRVLAKTLLRNFSVASHRSPFVRCQYWKRPGVTRCFHQASMFGVGVCRTPRRHPWHCARRLEAGAMAKWGRPDGWRLLEYLQAPQPTPF